MKVLKMKFGSNGAKVDAFGIRFYGNIDGKPEQLGSMSEILADPAAMLVTRHKRITLWFTLEKIRPYEKVADLHSMLQTRLKKEGYETVISSFDELVDTGAPEYANKPERAFPAADRMRGYNAARGFSVTAEKIDAKTKFTQAEIEAIRQLALRFGQIVYGRSLNEC